MADEKPGSDAIASLQKEAAESLSEVTGGASAKGTTEPPVPLKEAESMASRARKKYDSTLRWVLGVFSAVGLLIFGSVPFADLEDVEFWPWAGTGLIVAGLGLVLVIMATIAGLELQDASLGELGRTLSLSGSDRPYWWFPRRRAAYDLSQILAADSSAHLGPGVDDVGSLIDRLGSLDRRWLQFQVGWDGSPGGPSDSDLLDSVSATSSITELARSELESTRKCLEELRKQWAGNVDAARRADIAQAILKQERRARWLADLQPSRAQLRRMARSVALTATLTRYLEHRKLLLDESLVSQLRGTYRVVWRWLILGATLTLAGGLTYTYAIANPSDGEAPLARVLVSLTKDTPSWTAVEECRDGNDSSDVTALEGLLVSSDDADGLQDGPFSFVTTRSGCDGETVDVAEGDGSYERSPAVDGASTVTDGVETWPVQPLLVSAVLKRNTAAWLAARPCRAGVRRADLLNLRALLREADRTDERRNGPFTIETADPRCDRTVTIKVANGQGSYRVIRRP